MCVNLGWAATCGILLRVRILIFDISTIFLWKKGGALILFFPHWNGRWMSWRFLVLSDTGAASLSGPRPWPPPHWVCKLHRHIGGPPRRDSRRALGLPPAPPLVHGLAAPPLLQPGEDGCHVSCLSSPGSQLPQEGQQGPASSPRPPGRTRPGQAEDRQEAAPQVLGGPPVPERWPERRQVL